MEKRQTKFNNYQLSIGSSRGVLAGYIYKTSFKNDYTYW